jgi:Phage tail sheath protein subtilisin-like domain
MAVNIVQRASDVRVTEINLSSIIVSNSVTSACLAVISSQGSTVPMHFTNPDDFLAEYGNPNPAVSMTIQSGLNYFNEGSDLWAIRVVNSGYATAGALLKLSSAGMYSLVPMGLQDPLNTDLSTLVSGTDEAVAYFYSSKGPGSYGNNLSVSITSLAVAAPSVTAVSSNTGGTLSNAAYSYRVSALGSAGESLASSSAAITISGMATATGSVTLTWPAVTGAIGYNVYGRIAGSSYGLLAVVGGGTLTFTDTGALTTNTAIQPLTSPSQVTGSNEFTVSFWDNTNPNSIALETWTCTLSPQVSSSGAQMQLDDAINPFSQYVQVINDASALASLPQMNSIGKIALSGGASGTAPTSYNVVNALQIFKNTQVYKPNVFINGGIADPVTQVGLDTLVQARGDAVALLDVPSANQAYQSAIDYRNLSLNLNSTYSALFCPDLLQADTINGLQVYNPPSGWAAALCARTDRVANQAYSIAGLNRGLLPVLKTRYHYDDGQATALYLAQVNYERTFVGQGIALWEQRTLAGQQSALSWLSVRRIVNVIKTSLYSYLLYALQEMNSAQVRRSLTNGCQSYLDSIVAAQGLSSARFVCDDSNNTSDTFNAGILVCTAILVPMIPIHEIQLQVVISKSGVSFSEVLNQVTGKTQ